jgi:glutamine synthetase
VEPGYGLRRLVYRRLRAFRRKDLYALDPNTFSILPWRPHINAVARMFCDIVTLNEQYFEGDTRFVLRRNLERAAKMGFTYYVAPEIEHFYFKDSEGTKSLDQGATSTRTQPTCPPILDGKRC